MIEQRLLKLRPLALAVFAALNLTPAVQAACISLTALGSAYTQNFDTLATSGTTNVLSVNGWVMTESGGGARDNEQYGADTGASSTGDTYSYGPSANSDRALGGLRSGTLIPVFGACFTNDTGSAINALNIAYTGEEWRLGTAARTDQINFEYSTTATDLVTGTWTGVASLNFITPDTVTTGAKNGNASADRTSISSSVSSLSIANGASFWVRWTDTDATGADDGLAVDDFSLTPTGAATAGVTVAQTGGSTDVTEGGATDTYTIVLDSQPSADVTVSVAGDTQVSASPSTLTFTPANWNTAQAVTVTAVDDAAVEGAHTGTVSHTATSTDSNYNGLSIGAVTANITDNDAVPNLSINDASQNEGNSGTTNYTFTVSLSSPAPVGGVTFTIATADGTATAGSDYASQSLSSQTIAAGASSYTFTVAVNGDTAVEPNEAFSVNVTGVTGAALTDGQGSGTIVNDDIASACGEPATNISAVQGNGSSTPLNTSTSVEGIVVGDYQGDNTNSLRGFFIQEEDADADGDAATSEGLFVFDGTNPAVNVAVGDRVRVTGTPTEFFNMTQLGTVTRVEVCANNQTIPTPAALALPVPGVPNGDLAAATTAINNYFEAFEGMLVTFPATLKVSEYFELERYGQLVLSQGGRIPTYTNVSTPSIAGYINHQIKLAKRQIILDDGNNTQNFYVTPYATTNSIPLPYPTGGLSLTNRFRGGDSIKNLTGVLHWSFAGQSGTDAWRIRPVEEVYDYAFTAANPRKNNSPNVGGTLKISNFNVLNFFTTIDTTASSTSGPCSPTANQDCRGADSAAELARQTAKAAAALCGINADIFGLMELENNTTASLDALVTATSAVSGCGPYSYIGTGTIGGDAIKPGFLYKAATVTPVGNYALLTSAEDARFIDTKNRPSLAQTFKENATNEKLTVVANHLKSKGSACTDINASDTDNNDGQGNCNLTRVAAAQALVDWLAADPTGSGDPDFLLIGDMNSYAKEDPIKAIEKGADDTANTVDDYTNLVKTFGGNAAYSYVFDGQTGYLDHAIASKTLLPQVTGAADWHINADEPPSFDYNDTIKDTGESSFEAKPSALPLYAANPFRTSDHDPVIIGLKLDEAFNIINGTAARNVLAGTAGKDRITGFGAADTLTGGLGNDEFVFTSVTDGIDTITDFTLGQDAIDLAALLLSLGYEGGDPIADGVIKFAASGSNVIVYIDADGSAGPAVQRALIVVRNISAIDLNNAANFKF
ncbi:ExeM/NucH family extracellular endonuclease [Methylovulum miyakonense]|uniref:ExeM/NucH family extracellular endonuclease n=1 Tax=Methylovulum miyakonense TaxID=645578 RepID=UPI0003673E12|nr:ExeM/NucH family extracellular endonuclease [Methylovulum miyakonense]